MGYNCQHIHCKWSDYEENIDWGVYSNSTNIDCAACRKRCNADLNCTGIECGGLRKYAHCSWWRGQSCSHNEDRVVFNDNFQTCMKIIEGEQIVISKHRYIYDIMIVNHCLKGIPSLID